MDSVRRREGERNQTLYDARSECPSGCCQILTQRNDAKEGIKSCEERKGVIGGVLTGDNEERVVSVQDEGGEGGDEER